MEAVLAAGRSKPVITDQLIFTNQNEQWLLPIIAMTMTRTMPS